MIPDVKKQAKRTKSLRFALEGHYFPLREGALDMCRHAYRLGSAHQAIGYLGISLRAWARLRHDFPEIEE